MTIEHQDSEIILINGYEWTGEPDGVYLKRRHYSFAFSTIGNTYRVLLHRNKKGVIQISNEYHDLRYQTIETSLVGDVLILGMGLATIDQFLVTGTSWKWVENNSWLYANVSVTNGTKHFGSAEDMEFLATLGTFDTIFIDFPQTWNNDYSSLLNIGGTVIEMKI